MASLRYLPVGQVHVALGDLQLTTGVANHRLALSVRATATWLDSKDPQSYAQALLSGTVWSDQPSFRWVAGLEARVVTFRGYATAEELVASVSDDQVTCLERIRGHDQLALRIKLQATLLAPPAGLYPVAEEEFPVRLTSARWQELLDQAGTEAGVLVRVSGPLTDSALAPGPASNDDAGSLAQAVLRLRQARAELRDHRWEHCVATCRKVLKNISRLVTLPSAKSVSGTAAEQRGQEQRWAAIYWDVRSLANAAHHDDSTTEGFSWTRLDAEAILAATAALLARYTQSTPQAAERARVRAVQQQSPGG